MDLLLLSRPDSVNEVLPLLESRGTVTIVLDEDFRRAPREVLRDVPIAVSYSFGPILSAGNLATIGGPVINVHPTYLPWGRGIYPILWAAYEGTPQGASIHQIDPGIDSGPVFARELVDVSSDLTLEQARSELVGRAVGLLALHLDSIIDGHLVPVPQAELGARQPYRSRTQGVELLEKFPGRWHTTLGAVRLRGMKDGATRM
jgi:methionyl-tRNA formyltransferase